VTAVTASEPTVDREHPWPGLAAFGEEAREFFFGREEEQDELFRRIKRDRTTLLFGQSGLGKTSLLQAGLLPRLRDEGLIPVMVRLSFGSDANSPSEQLRALLAEATIAAGASEGFIAPDETLWEFLHRRRPSSDVAQREEQAPAPIFIFDQFEESFTLGLGRAETRAETQRFLAQLADLIEDRCPSDVRARLEAAPELIEQFDFGRSDYRIVITIREDFLPKLESLRSRAPSLGRNRLRLLRMDGTRALEAVLGPGPGLIEPDVAEQIVRLVGRPRPDDPFGSGEDLREMPLTALEVEPSLISLFCSELNERRIRAGADQITADAVMGNRDVILEGFYERAFKGLPKRVRTFVESELVTDSGFRESVAIERAERMLGRKRSSRKALDELVRRRVLHVEERFEVPRIELTHDLLTDVVRNSREKRQRRQRNSKWILALGGLVVLALVMLAVVLPWQAQEAERKYRAEASVWNNLAISCAFYSRDCDALGRRDPATLRRMNDLDTDNLLVSFQLVSAVQWPTNPQLSLKSLNFARTLLGDRPNRQAEVAKVLASRGEVAMSLAKGAPGSYRDAAYRDLSEARKLYRHEVENLKGATDRSSKDILRTDLATLAAVDANLALLNPSARAPLLREADMAATERLNLARDLNDRDDLVFALGSRSWIRTLSNQPAAALEDANRALMVDGNQGWVWVNKADALLVQGNVEEAVGIFSTAWGMRGQGPHNSACGNILDDMMALRTLGLTTPKRIERVQSIAQCPPRGAGGR
jgi:hypothetical protein